MSLTWQRSGMAGTVARPLDDRIAETVSVKDFGAAGNGTSDDTAAFNLAIAAANAVTPIGESANNAGATIFVPDGRYLITAALDPIKRGAVYIVGQSPGGTVLLPNFNGNVFRFEDLSSPIPFLIIGGGIANLKVEYLSTPGTSACLVELLNTYRFSLVNLFLENVGRLAKLGNATKLAGSLALENVRGSFSNIGVPAIAARHGSGLFMSPTCLLFVAGVTNPTVDRLSTMTTATGRSVIDAGEYSWDTVVIAGLYERFWRGLNITAQSGAVAQNFWIVPGTIFDYCADDAVQLNSLAGGTISSIKTAGAWLASWSGASLRMLGAGNILDVRVSNLISPFAGDNAIACTAANAKRISIEGGEFIASNRTNHGAPGIVFSAGDEIAIRGVASGIDGTPGGLAWQAYDGIYVAADIANYEISSCDSHGTNLAYNLPANSTSSANRRCHDNRHANYAGQHTGTGWALPASTVAWENKTAFRVQVIISGGTVSAIAFNGVATGLTSYNGVLEPGDTITPTYSSAPTMLFFAKA